MAVLISKLEAGDRDTDGLGVEGPTGPAGPKGDTGAKGDKGDTGEVTQAELDALTARVEALETA